MRKSCFALAGLLAAQCPVIAVAARCAAEHASYVQAGRTGVTAELVPAGRDSTAASDLHFVVKPKSRSYRFRFQQANGYGGISLEPIDGTMKTETDSLRDDYPVGPSSDLREFRFIPYRADLTEIADAPRSGGRPPRLIVLPDLGAALWYDASALGEPNQREAMSRSVFILSGCDRKAGRPRR